MARGYAEWCLSAVIPFLVTRDESGYFCLGSLWRPGWERWHLAPPSGHSNGARPIACWKRAGKLHRTQATSLSTLGKMIHGPLEEGAHRNGVRIFGVWQGDPRNKDILDIEPEFDRPKRDQATNQWPSANKKHQ
jgi:hypothetical protein